ncbi:palmdelphin-like [Cheilinus undulatus]|uniref:palmdelphin-like n=1 Tax=Cheilinus undulatus TaxID=241271 RepID=UPI001BD37D6C|nr:palmdelphin-like [Cheilinus undulatus]
MEESDLLRERLHAITEKRRIQEDIRQKKEELDREKLKLQHLKKKSLREQWLLQGANTHNATDSTQQQQQQQQSTMCDQQQAKILQLKIHRMEMDILSLEREESIVSTNESFILRRLKAVEKSPQDIIKEAQDSFVPDPPSVTPVVPDSPEYTSPADSHLPEPTPQRQTLFAMEINVTKNLLTGESTVLSTTSVSADEINQHTGLKVYDDGRKCVYALNPPEGSHDQRCLSELSANEVEQLLRSASKHRQANRQNYHPPPSRRKEHYTYNHHNEKDRAGGGDINNMGSHHGNHLLSNNQVETDFHWRPNAEHRYSHHENYCRRQEDRNNQNNLREGHRHGNHSGLGHQYGNQRDGHYSSYEGCNCQEDRPHRCCISRSNSRVTGRANGCPTPRSRDQEVVSAHQQQLCYTPANHIPLSDYISVDEEELYCLNQPSDHNGNHRYTDAAPSDRMPSPLFEDNAAYTILNAVDTTEPITAIFMGFQTAHDDSGPAQEYEGSLKAEIIVIEDNDEEDDGGNHDTKENSNGHQPGVLANGNVGQTLRQGPGIRRIQKKHRHCCAVC